MIRELYEAGHDVIASDIVSPSETESLFPEGTEYIECDLLGSEGVGAMVEEAEPDLIFHLAAQSSGGISISKPLETFRINIIGFINLMEAVRLSGREIRVVAVGSGEEYGKKDPGQMPLGEDAQVDPANPYAASKASQTVIAIQYHRTYGIDVMATRSFNHTGPGQTDTFVFPSFARKCSEIASGLRKPLLRTGNLDIVRDFTDVRDVVTAYRLLAAEGIPGKVYNVCSGEGLKLRDGLDIIIAQFDIDVEIGRDPDLFRPADVPVFIGDNSRLSDETGWKRKIPAAKMMSDLVEYWRSRYSS